MAIFAKTIDHGSFRGAARELRLSPSVVSHHISQLEEHLGVALLYRTTRKLTLTSEGERLLAATQNMLDAVEDELNDLTSSARDPSGELRITAPSVLSQSPFTDMLATFMARYPRIRLSLDFSDSRKELISDGFDIAIRMTLKPVGNSPSTRKLFRVPRKLVAAPELLASRPAAQQPSDLADWPWLELTPVQDREVAFHNGNSKQTMRRSGYRSSCNDAQALYRLARAGTGLAIVPDFLASKDAATDAIRFVLPEWQVAPAEVFAEWPVNAPKHGLVRLFVDTLCSY
ncbi:LysR family transcriptional regulator [Alisedimentitalea sp. MJ-SS2]|uniref:LysR family transcriptional regulator n=1 Tax=Aliisedimentitalea sp. MJ-SS2 TaxID=3049795 RepID=UPI002909AA06|nr:LysR family transcriptional regulator [Alisedimentitalea sp. MJ-SS2]MDU8927407.1 LysR family transcriptional regulator [Alisedimentitalea sp. MJ-SS2]